MAEKKPKYIYPEIVEHARRELKLINGYDRKAPDGGRIARAVDALAVTLANSELKPIEREYALQAFGVLANGELLSEPTPDPKEWTDVSKEFEGKTMFQNNRCGKYFCRVDDYSQWEHVDNGRMGKTKPPLKDRVEDVAKEEVPTTPDSPQEKHQTDTENREGGPVPNKA